MVGNNCAGIKWCGVGLGFNIKKYQAIEGPVLCNVLEFGGS
jgi:hypothetical protein